MSRLAPSIPLLLVRGDGRIGTEWNAARRALSRHANVDHRGSGLGRRERASVSISAERWRGSAGVPFEPVVFANNAEVLAAARTGAVDMVFTNATPARRKDLDFSPTVLQVEQGYLVPAGSTIRAIGRGRPPGLRVGVSEGSTSEATLSGRSATQRCSDGVAQAPRSTCSRRLARRIRDQQGDPLRDVGQAARFPRAPGRWGLESFAIGIPKGRKAAMPVVRGFVVDAKTNGLVRRAVERAGLRGAVFPD